MSSSLSPWFKVVHHGPDFLVVHKSPGINMHFQNQEPGLCALVRKACALPALWPVHRLDQDTSGLVLLATTKKAAQQLSALFARQQVHKFYLALVDKRPNKKQGWIQGDMLRSRRKTWKLCRTMHNPARTLFLSQTLWPGWRLMVLRPLTGKTHQLRVAMKAVGAPIVGDKLYHPLGPKAERLYLHAQTLIFTHGGQCWRFSSAPDQGQYFVRDEFKHCLATLGPLEDLPWPQG